VVTEIILPFSFGRTNVLFGQYPLKQNGARSGGILVLAEIVSPRKRNDP
jgi:hypothetical protein